MPIQRRISRHAARPSTISMARTSRISGTARSTISICSAATTAACCAIRRPPPVRGARARKSTLDAGRRQGRGALLHGGAPRHPAGVPAHTPYLVLLVDLDTQKGKPTETRRLRVVGNLTTPDGKLAPPDHGEAGRHRHARAHGVQRRRPRPRCRNGPSTRPRRSPRLFGAIRKNDADRRGLHRAGAAPAFQGGSFGEQGRRLLRTQSARCGELHRCSGGSHDHGRLRCGGDQDRADRRGDAYRNVSFQPGMPVSDKDYCWTVDDRNKRSLALDLKRPEAQKVIHDLIISADVFITNYPPPVRRRLGIAFDHLPPKRAAHLRVADRLRRGGDGGNKPGFNATAWWARSGLMDLVRPEEVNPARSFPGMGDHPSALGPYGAIVTALCQREKTGKGAHVGSSLLANGFWANACLFKPRSKHLVHVPAAAHRSFQCAL